MTGIVPAELAADPDRAAGAFGYGLRQLRIGGDALAADNDADVVATVIELADLVAEQHADAADVGAMLLRRLASLTLDMLATQGMSAEVHAAAVRAWLVARAELAEQRQQSQQTRDEDHSDDDEE